MPAVLDEEFWDEVDAELDSAACGVVIEFIDGPLAT
jgi:hypothetical protein